MFSLNKLKLSPTITDMIRFDHSHVMLTFHQYTKDKRPAVKKALAETICTAVEIHAMLEEEIFYPAIRRIDGDDAVIQKSEPEHNEIRRSIADLRMTDAADPQHDKRMLELMREIIHHVADEETVLLPMAEEKLSHAELCDLGSQMTKRRMQLVTPKAGAIAKNTLVGFSGSTTALVLGAAGALFAARAITRRTSHA